MQLSYWQQGITTAQTPTPTILAYQTTQLLCHLLILQAILFLASASLFPREMVGGTGVCTALI